MSDAKTEKIIEAAERLFLANGLRATTMEAIAREAGVAKPTLYDRFSDKENLFRAVVDRRFSVLREGFAAALAGEGGAAERIAWALAAKFTAIHEMLRRSPHATEILEANAALAGGETEALFDWTCGQIAATLVAEGMADAEAKARARLVVAAVDGLKAHADDRLGEDVRFVAARLLA